ncbi:MAG: hypothetical protein WCH34_09760 [Bacteroidota bacterium]
MDLHSYYQQRITFFEDKEKECIAKDRKLPFYRLLTVVIGITLFVWLFQTCIYIAIPEFILFIAVFIFTVRKDHQNAAKRKEYELLKLLNENEINSLNGNYDYFDDGKRFKDESHPYADDLDIFGTSSLFQLINRCTLSKSSEILANWLLHPAMPVEISERNEAIRELSEKIDWRQRVFVKGFMLKKNERAFANLIYWVKKDAEATFSKRFILLCNLLSVVTLTSIGLSFVFSLNWLIAILIFTHLFIIRKTNQKVKQAHNEVSDNSNALKTYNEILQEIENESFTSPKLLRLKSLLQSGDSLASKEIKKLSGIVDDFDVRYNVYVHPFLNILLFWDIHQLNRLDKWKQRNKNLEQWFASVGEFEALSSFANLSFSHPDYCFPRIIEKHFHLDANNMGHPLIVEKDRVSNNFMIDGAAKIILISGSNMSGKSTFLRTVGINMILGMAGSCVCASEMTFSPVRILSSMRIADSLKDNTSSFFAELKKLESIIKEVERNEKVFFLLDEILRGTNSIDRHIGSTALIKQFISNEAVGIIATHDLALTDMKQDFPDNIENYNFNIKIHNEDLFFDYMLNQGVCTSLNASILMKKMGIKGI